MPDRRCGARLGAKRKEDNVRFHGFMTKDGMLVVITTSTRTNTVSKVNVSEGCAFEGDESELIPLHIAPVWMWPFFPVGVSDGDVSWLGTFIHEHVGTVDILRKDGKFLCRVRAPELVGEHVTHTYEKVMTPLIEITLMLNKAKEVAWGNV